MVRRSDIRFGLLCLVALTFIFTVSCAKKTPQQVSGMDQSQAAATGTDQEMTEAQRQQMMEEDIEAKRKAREAREKAERESMAKKQFLSEAIYFGFDDSTLTRPARMKLRDKVEWLRNNPDACIVIEGHCDERGTDEYNLALG